MTVSPETGAKADPPLRRLLAASVTPDPLPVMVTLAPAPPPIPAASAMPADRARWARAQEETFAQETAMLVAELEAHGATAIRRHWMARSLSGELPLEAIDAAGRRPEVIRLALVVRRDVLL